MPFGIKKAALITELGTAPGVAAVIGWLAVLVVGAVGLLPVAPLLPVPVSGVDLHNILNATGSIPNVVSACDGEQSDKPA